MKIDIPYNGEKYVIYVTEQSFDLFKVQEVKDTSSKNFGSEIEKPLGYCTTISSAIQKIIRSNMAQTEDSISLSQYIDIIKSSYEELKRHVDLLTINK